MKLANIALLTLPILLAGVAIALPRALLDAELDPVGGTAFTAAGVARLHADQAALAALGVYADAGRARDAGAVLNALVAYDGALAGKRAAWWASTETYGTSEWREGWLERAADTADLDLSLVATLRAYDHWDLYAAGTLAAHVAGNPNVRSLERPLPMFESVRTLGRLRLLQGLHRGDMVPALEEARHLATLVYTTESLVAALVAVTLLQDERAAWERAVAAGTLAPDAWRPYSEAELALLGDVTLGMAGVWMPTTPAEVRAAVLAEGVPRYGTCGALAEADHVLSLVRGPLADPYPLERDLSEPFTAFAAALELAQDCRLSVTRADWAARPRPPPGELDSAFLAAAERLPWWRQVPAARGIATVTPTFTERYAE